MTQRTCDGRRSGVLKWGMGGVGAVAVGVAACSVACSTVVPVVLALGVGSVTAAAIGAGVDVAGAVVAAAGVLTIVLAGVRWRRQRRSCGCKGATAIASAVGRPGDAPLARTEPLACSLDGEGVRRRIDEFRDVFARGHLGSERTPAGVRWRFRAVPGLEAELRSLAEREQACCRFFRFDIRGTGAEIWWDTRVDDAEAHPILEEFFDLPRHLADDS